MNNNKVRSIYVMFDNTFHLLSEILLSFIKRLAPFVIAILPGTIFGWTMYSFILSMTGNVPLSLSVGFSGFVGLESVGIWSGHKTASYLSSDKIDKKIAIPLTTLLLYVVIGISTFWFLDAEVARNVKIIATSFFLLAFGVYILFGLDAYDEREAKKKERQERQEKIEEKEEKIDAREYRRQQNEEKKRFERELKLKELELSHEEKMAAVSVVQVPQVQAQPQIQEQKKKKSRYDQKKMQRLVNLLKVKPDALETMDKIDISDKLNISRPTLDRYIEIYNKERLNE